MVMLVVSLLNVTLQSEVGQNAAIDPIGRQAAFVASSAALHGASVKPRGCTLHRTTLQDPAAAANRILSL
jgi:hypothetical protein